jgi:hypothetical protein
VQYIFVVVVVVRDISRGRIVREGRTSAPIICATWIAARPTPPAAEWMRIVYKAKEQSANSDPG